MDCFQSSTFSQNAHLVTYQALREILAYNKHSIKSISRKKSVNYFSLLFNIEKRNFLIWGQTHGLPFQAHTTLIIVLLGTHPKGKVPQALCPGLLFTFLWNEVRAHTRQWVLHYPKAMMIVLFSSWCTQTQLSYPQMLSSWRVLVAFVGLCNGYRMRTCQTRLVNLIPWVYWGGETGKFPQS